jgi:hypothetical protein
MEIVKQFGFGLWISTGSEEDNYNVLYVHLLYPGFYFHIPKILKMKMYCYDYARLVSRRYGFNFCEEYLFVYYGINPGIWINNDPEHSDRVKLIGYPWNYGIAIRHSFFDIKGNYIYDWKKLSTGYYKVRQEVYNKLFVMEKMVNFTDFDGEENAVTISIEEMEWRRGTTPLLKKLFRPFCKPLINRYIKIEFNKEVGKGKGSWKGGVMGMTFAMRKNETIDECWERFLKQKLGEL